MRKFATGTTVTAAKTEGEIKEMLSRRGVTKIGTMDDGETYTLGFQYEGMGFKICLPLPDPDDRRFTHYKQGGTAFERVDNAKRELYEKEVNRRWRAFGAVIKAKIVAVEEGISTMEAEFIGNAIMRSGRTVAEEWSPRLPQLLTSGDIKALEPPK